MKKQTILFFILLILGNMITRAQNCSVNAGANVTICGTSASLSGSPGGSISGNPTWTLVSKPAGAPDPVIVNPAGYNTNVTGMTSPGSYIFQIAQNCTVGTATSQVTITAPGEVSTFTAGPDITNVNATTGTVTLNGVVPNGYTASWSAYNIYRWERSGIKTSQNSQFSSTTSATTTFSLVNKANHDIDPAYVVTLRITSTNNPNCWYEDTAIVRFIPNPQILPTVSTSRCISNTGNHFITLQNTSPKFSKGYPSSPGSSGNFGTTVTMNVTSQPAGGNIAYANIYDDNIFFTGVNVVGVYKFTLTITNSSGTYTTPELTYTYNGIQPNPVNFLVASRPEQMMIYDGGSSGGEVHCGYAGQSTPITFYYTINPADNPATINTAAVQSGTPPPGGAVVVVNGGAGTATRSATVTPPAGGWSVGTYRFTITRDNAGACLATQSYYIHISDGSRPNVTVPATTVCYPGSGVVTATIPLPAVYKGVVNSSYFQDFDGRYRLTLVSKPAGAADPVFEPYASTLFTNTSTTISNLTTQGEYVFKIKADTYNTSVGTFLDKEYACSGTSLEGTFSVFVSAQVGSNAGSAQTLVGTSQTTFNANNPGVAATGAWTLLTKPAGATDPVIATPSAYNTSVTGFNTQGTYTFRWTVTTGTCTSTSDLTVNVMAAAPGGVTAAVWYKADAITFSDNTLLNQWNDQMGTGYNLVQTTAAQQPTFSNQSTLANFNPTVTFISAGHGTLQGGFMAADPGTGNAIINRTQGSIYIAGNMNSLGAAGLAGFDATMDYPGLHTNNTSPYDKLLFYANTANSNYSTLSTNSFAAKNPFVAGSSWLNGAGATASNLLAKIWLNGSESVYNNRANVAGTETTARIFRLGRDTNWGSHDGQMNEAIVFATPLTASEKARVDSYLSVKWGSTLLGDYVSSGNTVVWNTSATYQNNILGIARDNISTLYQKQSRSENPNQKLIIGIGSTLANTNAGNANTLTDGQFLLAGDNGLRQSLTTPLTFSAGSNGVANYRFESIWKAQNTGNVGTVTMAWPKGVKNLYLVQSPDAVFDGTDTFTPMSSEVTVNGVVYNTANVTLTNGQYFTFAGYMHAPGGVVSSLWYRADKNLVPTGGAVTSWTDYSAGSVIVTPNLASTTSAPAAVDGIGLNLNFNPGVTFVPANALGNSSILNAVSSTNYSIYTSTTPVTGSGYDRVVGLNYSALTGGNKYDSPGIASVYINMRDNTSGSHINAAVAPVTAQYTQLSNTTIVRNSFTDSQFQRALNGAAVISSMVMTPLTTWPDGGIVLGRNANDGGDDNGTGMTMSETIVFDKALTTNEINRVDSYLAIKGGITLDIVNTPDYLSSNSVPVWASATNTGYNNNIFGIANDKLSDLNQIQSNSINVGQRLIIGAGNSLANTNASNTNTLADGQFLMTGDNGLLQGLKTPLVYTAGSNGTTNYRFESIWKVQNTGSVGTVTVAWPKGLKNLYLVQSPDAVFDGTDTFTPMITEVTVNGVVYNTANVTLGNGQFFTFAGFGNAPGGVANGLSYWYRADKNTVNTGAGTDVTGWTDVWNGTTVAQLGTNTLPKYVLGASNYFNFNPGINFTVGTQTLGNNTVRTLTSLDFDVFTLTKEGLASGGGNPRLFSVGMDNTTTGSANWDAFGIFPNTTNLERRPYGAGTQFPGVNPAFDAAIPSIMYFKNTNTTSAKGLNGAAMNTAVNYAAVNAQYGGHIFGNTVFSGNGSDNAGFTGHIGETIVYGAGTLTTTERRRVDSYLAIKYGITLGQVNTDHYLDTAGNIVWNGTTNTTYNNNIFGVGRDDIEILEQKVSKSVNAGTILAVATTNDFVNPNQDVARTGFAQDKTYLVLGDNNNTNLALNSITVNGFTGGSRVQRQWLAQPTNAVGTVNFGVDLSSYGAGFGNSAPVKMMVADDAAFTTNVVYVAGTYDATSGKWVHPYNFAAGQNKYITYVTVDETSCTTGCNNNTYLTATDPNTIEYDNIVASEGSTIVKQKDGSFYVWGYGVSPNVSTSNSNVVLNLLTPTKIDPATSLPGSGSGFNYTGTPLKATTSGGGSGIDALVLLTTDGLYTWGHTILPISLRSTGDFRFGKQSVNGKADGLPPGVSPTNVKMMVANQGSLTITTCSGAVWNYNTGYYGDNAPVSTANNTRWHRVMTSATQTLDNVVAVRGIWNTKLALTSNGKLYTWGYRTFLNDNNNPVVSNYATEISVPTGVTPKMIGMTEGVGEGESSYYLLATNGKLYAMGYNSERQLGDGTVTQRNNWVEITATATDANSVTHSLGGNIAWISPAEHVNDYPSINILTTDGKQWGWGYNLRQQLGSSSSPYYVDPRYMPGNGTAANQLGLNDKVIAVEDGGYHVINFKESSTSFGFIGIGGYGIMGDGYSGTPHDTDKYLYISPLDLCGATTASALCYKPGILTGTALDTKMGITALNRAGANSDNWPMVRKGGWLALEAKSKGFVPNRVAFDASGNPVGIPAANFVEGMMVYDTTNKCIKMYTLKEGDASMAWHCISTQTCPD
ncbi:hypothetical protein [Chryseobacterium sp. CP-77]|uniref:hypothetical protein n=1 Tax=Chryseobacterium sp. CP-77 TaxID=3116594 RepID=UPI002ED31E2C